MRTFSGVISNNILCVLLAELYQITFYVLSLLFIFSWGNIMGSLRRWRLVIRLQRRAADVDVTADPSAPSQCATTTTTTSIEMSGLEGEVSASGSVQVEDGPGPSSMADLKAAYPLQAVVVHSEAPPPSYNEVKEEGGTG
jgi:hypothetical protein